MIGDIILAIKTWWKQLWCIHEYEWRGKLDWRYEECKKCGRLNMKEVDALYKSPSVTPQIFSDLFEYYEDDKNFIDTLTELINIYNIDSKLKMPDFIIAEMVRNNLATLYNTLKENKRHQSQ